MYMTMCVHRATPHGGDICETSLSIGLYQTLIFRLIFTFLLAAAGVNTPERIEDTAIYFN